MRIQYASDLHLELYTKTTFDETIEPTAPYLVLCGDIAKLDNLNLRSFLEYISERWKLIFWIPGNEEIWNSSKSEEESLRKMSLAQKGHSVSDETKKKISESQKVRMPKKIT